MLCPCCDRCLFMSIINFRTPAWKLITSSSEKDSNDGIIPLKEERWRFGGSCDCGAWGGVSSMSSNLFSTGSTFRFCEPVVVREFSGVFAPRPALVSCRCSFSYSSISGCSSLVLRSTVFPLVSVSLIRDGAIHVPDKVADYFVFDAGGLSWQLSKI